MNGKKSCFSRQSTDGECDNTTINWIMLRYRPIAPKPSTNESGSRYSPTANKNEITSKRRSKRKYVRVKKNVKCEENKEEERKQLADEEDATLQGYPEMTNQIEPAGIGSSQGLDAFVMKPVQELPLWINLDKPGTNAICCYNMSNSLDRAIRMPSERVIESWVVVEGMTGTSVEGELGCTDMEKMKNLSADACPGLISDSLNTVQWMNPAYRRMVTTEEDGEPTPEVVVWLVAKEKLQSQYESFVCRVRVVYTWQKEKYSKTVPCDVWKMEFGGFAWRLDIRTALSLGR